MHTFKPYSLNICGRLVTISHPWIMGIINVTPDSFYAASRATATDVLLRKVGEMIDAGVDIIDLGACSTRPGSEPPTKQQELERLVWALPIVKRATPSVLLSVDTYRSEVALQCVEQWGADMINDISGGTLDAEMFEKVSRLCVPYVLTHTRGEASVMMQHATYTDVTAEVLEWLAHRIDKLRQLGVADVIVDPGFGFAKTVEQNYEMLRQLEAFHALEAPLLVGLSRKRMVYEPLQVAPDEALNGTTVLNTLALLAGTHILRVHDVKAAVETRQLLKWFQVGQGSND